MKCTNLQDDKQPVLIKVETRFRKAVTTTLSLQTHHFRQADFKNRRSTLDLHSQEVLTSHTQGCEPWCIFQSQP